MASWLAAVVIALAALAGWAEVHALRSSGDPHPGQLITVGVVSAALSLHALWYLQRVATERRGWLGGWFGASVSFVAAVTALVFLVFLSLLGAST